MKKGRKYIVEKIELSERTCRLLKAVAKKNNISISRLIRILLDLDLERSKP